MPDTVTNKRLITEAFDALATGDSRPLIALFAEDVTWKVMGGTPWSRTYRGKQSVLNDLLRELGARLTTRYKARAERIIAEGEFVVVQARGEAATDAGEYNNEYCFVYRLEDGKIREVTEYLDTELVVAALGQGRSSRQAKQP